MAVNPDFKDLFAALNGASAKYLLVGGYAVSFHAEPRFTNSIDGVEFAEAWPEKVASTYGDQAMLIIGREALIQNKRASGRPQDLIDVDLLERHSQ